jgi:hypothetical protein
MKKLLDAAFDHGDEKMVQSVLAADEKVYKIVFA